MRTTLVALALGIVATAAAAQAPVPEPPQYIQPGEELVFGCDGHDQFGPGVAVTSCATTVTKLRGPDSVCAPAAAVASGSCTASGTQGLQRIVPGNRHGCDLQLSITATMANSQIITCDREIRVRKVELK